MKLGKRTVYCLLLALICANILLRLPRSEHETGVDSFFVHTLAASISDQGRAAWVINPLGYFGWYPLSYPSAGPFLISGLSQVTGLTEEGGILDLNLLYGVIGVLAAFALARSVRRDDVFALTMALIFSLAPRFMSFTLWSASTRNLFTALMPVFLWMMVRTYRNPTLPNLLVLTSVVVMMLATHRLTILLAVVVLAFVLAYVFIVLHRVMRVRFPRYFLARDARRWTPRLTLLLIVLTAVLMLLGTDVLNEYSEGEICKGQTLRSQLCNLGVSTTRSVGLALPFALVGIMMIVREHNKGFLEAFLVFSMIALIPTLFLRQYAGFYILPFVAAFAAQGVLGLMKVLAKRPRAAQAAVVASLVAISGSSLAILEVEVERFTAITDANYTTGLYVRSLPEGNFVANDGLLGIRVASISGRGGLPIGGAGTTHQSAELLIFGVVNATTVFASERRIPLTELTIEDDSPFILGGVNAIDDWIQDILEQPVIGIKNQTIAKYRLQYFIENDQFRDAYVAWESVRRWPEYDADFPRSVHAERYKLYDGTTEDIYLVFPPSLA